jgi:hypothetical protein
MRVTACSELTDPRRHRILAAFGGYNIFVAKPNSAARVKKRVKSSQSLAHPELNRTEAF